MIRACMVVVCKKNFRDSEINRSMRDVKRPEVGEKYLVRATVKGGEGVILCKSSRIKGRRLAWKSSHFEKVKPKSRCWKKVLASAGIDY